MKINHFENTKELALTPHHEGIKHVFGNNSTTFNTLIAAMLSLLIVGCRCSGSRRRIWAEAGT